MNQNADEHSVPVVAPPLFIDVDQLEKTLHPPKEKKVRAALPKPPKRARAAVKEVTKEKKRAGRPRKNPMPETPAPTPTPEFPNLPPPDNGSPYGPVLIPIPTQVPLTRAEEELEQSKGELRLYIIWEGAQRGYTKDVLKQKVDEVEKLSAQDVMFELSLYKAQQQTQTNSHMARIVRDSVGKLLDTGLRTNGEIEKALQQDPMFQEALAAMMDGFSARLGAPARLGFALGANIFRGLMEKKQRQGALAPPIVIPAPVVEPEKEPVLPPQ